MGLIWNSMMSVAGGWFFLMACEMFVLGNRDLRLPGLGSYLQTAANAGNTRAIVWGLAVMIGIIVAMDRVVWRPVIAWAEKFKFEQVEAAESASFAGSRPAAPLARVVADLHGVSGRARARSAGSALRQQRWRVRNVLQSTGRWIARWPARPPVGRCGLRG